MDPTTEVTGLFDGLVVYGPMGICLVYFMVKDWIKNSKQNELMASVAVALEKVASAMNMCNKNGMA